jgi:sulfite exporter TauE/SafE
LETVDLVSVITIALLGSLGHCVGMCGGIVIAYSSSRLDAGWSRPRQALAHLAYGLGRTLTYTALGFVFGYLGGVTTFSNVANGSLLIAAGLAMVLAGLSLDGRLPFLKSLANPVSDSKAVGGAFRKAFTYLLEDRSISSLFLLGMLNGFLPCGFVYFFAITAASTSSPVWGGLVMFVFGLCTIPALFSLGFFVTLFQRGRLRQVMVKIATLAVIGYGLYTIYSGYEYIIDPEKFILDCHGG